MFAELQMLTPLVPTRELYFVRYSKQLNANKWAIVDISIDNVEKNIDVSLARCRKRPSGCILEKTSTAHYVCEVKAPQEILELNAERKWCEMLFLKISCLF